MMHMGREEAAWPAQAVRSAELVPVDRGLGLLWFCDAAEIDLRRPESILVDPIWWTANGPHGEKPLIG